MVVLALDTTTPAGSCALAVDGSVVREEASDVSLPPATRLPLDLMTLLEHSAGRAWRHRRLRGRDGAWLVHGPAHRDRDDAGAGVCGGEAA